MGVGAEARTRHTMRSDQPLPDRAASRSRSRRGYLLHAEGSVLIEAGRTQVICTASVEDRVPPFLRNTGKGWVTAEYGMLPRATTTRYDARGVDGQGRRPHAGDPASDRPRRCARSRSSRRSASARSGSTATSSRPTAARARPRSPARSSRWCSRCGTLVRDGQLVQTMPVQDYVAATSVGIVDGVPLLDLAYDEDSRAEVDMNVVKTGDGRYIEVQGTAEAHAVRPRRPARDCSTWPTPASPS